MIEFEGTINEALRTRTRQHHGRLWLTLGVVLVVAGIAGFLAQPAPFEISRHWMPIFAALVGGAMVTAQLSRGDRADLLVRGSVSEQRLSILIWIVILGIVLLVSPYFTRSG